jgi:hypothetical protein
MYNVCHYFPTLLKKEKGKQNLEKLPSIKVHKICSVVLELLHAERRGKREKDGGTDSHGEV